MITARPLPLAPRNYLARSRSSAEHRALELVLRARLAPLPASLLASLEYWV
jgi:hypothetical protein